MQCGDVEKLIKRRQDPEESPVYYVSIEDTFEVIMRVHLATGHGGRDRMTKEVNKKYANITREALELFKSFCEECQKKRKRPRTKGVVVRPILTKEFASRGQVDLIDMQSMAQNSFKWIMVYQDHLTKFVVLRPLTCKRAAAVAHQLLDIFLLFGAPSILQSDNGSEFTAEVITELKEMWPSLVMVHGKPRHPQSQGSVERANGDIKDMLVAWMGDNKTNDWTIGLKFVQFQKNSSLHAGIQRSPYMAMFGCDAKVGLSSSTLPTEVLGRLQSEEELLALNIPQISTSAQSSCDDDDQQTASTQDLQDLGLQLEGTLPDTGASRYESSEESPESVQQDTVMGDLDQRHVNIHSERNMAQTSQLKQAERMVKRSRVEMVAGKVGDNVAVPIPLVDRGRGDPRNILGIVLDRNENDLYTICVKGGILKGKYSRNQFDICPQTLLTEQDVDQTKTISLRQAVNVESSSGGQGFVRCNCSGHKKCQTNRCKCFKNKVKCSSRCHNSLNCKNK